MALHPLYWQRCTCALALITSFNVVVPHRRFHACNIFFSVFSIANKLLQFPSFPFFLPMLTRLSFSSNRIVCSNP
ncbi:hypothetical protein M441DRAFT_58478 [Trichoderma asperellum CBS 433.97]|uniref:Uncharacterized protein n=1 Tax=Trichoderma asperellum (strain ATCC 204424 / CBS 433.97 / NBRC 101777) TaxID=1042311 RepID=A0A2T3Z8A1_TRIA4|nr:hypothetical protein M441DRAFT_58478 [Trichoderma asperellum CBS 433.97]PTB41039.1 hypothetical protein M441DRAFT_58478 [Trichoderma asperellum CBS 433.97]